MENASPQPESEEFRRILDEARNGSVAAIGRLLEWRRVLLEWYIAANLPRMLQSKVAVSDIYQDAVIDARRDFRMFLGSSEGEFFNWLKSIVTHTLHDTIRHYDGVQKRDVTREVRLGDGTGSTADQNLLPGQGDPALSAIRREDQAMLTRLIDLLPDDHRTVIRLRSFEGLTFPQVGERMGRSEDAVRKLWERAFDALIALMGPGDGRDPHGRARPGGGDPTANNPAGGH
ncbi:MAG: sigma-70 family RNA polymerase sigma factor [Pirellulales bacterium]